MKILYAIQATGNGHLTQANDLIPVLQQKGTVDILVSGTEADIELAYPVKYKLKGLSFTFGKRGGIDILSTIKKLRLRRLLKDINSLPVELYDLIINDFEPISAWACRKRKIPCIRLSHQSTLLNPKTPKPKNAGVIGKIVLKYYAPTKIKYGFHFENYDINMFTPVIRQLIRESNCSNEGHYTVYLPAYSIERITQILSQFKQIDWQVFSKYTRKIIVHDNIMIHPIDKAAFIQSIISSDAVLCGAGFETPAESLYLKKKLLVIP